MSDPSHSASKERPSTPLWMAAPRDGVAQIACILSGGIRPNRS